MQDVHHGVTARYSSRDARWFAGAGFAPMIVGAIGMIGSGVSYFGWAFDIGSFFGAGTFILTESVLMIPLYFFISMLFFAGGVEWYVLCRHCPCYEHSGKEHGNENRFYCLANWGSPRIFECKPGPISRLGQATFLVWTGFYLLFPVVYLVDRWEFVIIQLVMTAVFVLSLRHWVCSQCPNFWCVLNCVDEKSRRRFLEAVERGEVY
jgi:hypothetical protein